MNPATPTTPAEEAPRPAGKTTAKRLLFRGLVLLLPTLITLFFLLWACGLINTYFVSHIVTALKWFLGLVGFSSLFPVDANGDVVYPWAVHAAMVAVSVLIGITFLGFVGLMIGTLIGKRVWGAVESRMTRIPLVRYVYPFVREVTDLVLTEHKTAFRSVVVFQYPRLGLWSVGFLTGPGFEAMEKAGGRKLVSVFVPSSPTPMTGYIVFVPEEDVTPLDITFDEAFRLIMSGGAIVPGGRKPVAEAPGAPSKASQPAGSP